MTSSHGVAFLGSGFIAFPHAIAVRAVPGAKLVAVASNSRAAAESRARILDADPYTFGELDSLLAREDVTVVYVQSPNACHGEHMRRSLMAGKHVVIEKPMAVTLDEAEAACALADSRKLGIGYAENHVFAPVVQKAKHLIDEGRLGSVRRVRGFFGHWGYPLREAWQWNPDLAGGGAQMDLGSHALATALYLAGQATVTEVTRAEMIPAPHAPRMDVFAHCQALTREGIDIEWTGSWREGSDRAYYEVEGDRGSLRCDVVPGPVGQRLVLTGAGERPVEIPFADGSTTIRVLDFISCGGYVGQLQHFLQSFATGEEPIESGRHGAHVLRTLLASYAAAGRKKGVRLDDVPVDATPGTLWRD